MKKNSKGTYGLMVITALLIVLIGVSYAWLMITLKADKFNVIKAGSLSLRLKEENEIGIRQDLAVPVVDEVGLKSEAFTFTLENNGNITSNYTIFLDDILSSFFPAAPQKSPLRTVALFD